MKKFGISSICEIEDLCTKSDSMVRRVCRIITMCVLLLLTANHAAEGGNRRIISEKITIYYRFDSADINPDYRSNKEQIETFRNILLDPRKIDSISIHSWASPDGSSTYNLKLAQKRGENVSRFISDELKAVGKNAAISTNTHPQENWQGLADLVSSSYTRHDKTRVLNIINDTSIGSETRKWRLQQLDGGYTWDYICRHYMPQLRTSTFVTIWISEPQTEETPTEEKPVEEASADESPVVEQASAKPATLNQKNEEAAVTEPAPVLALPRIPVTALRSNLLVPALNIGAEVPLGNRWSVSADYYFPWIWPSPKNKDCFELLGWSVEGRYWFGKGRTAADRLQGHSLALYGAGGYYDFERNYEGQQGEFVSAGLDYTYAMPIGRKKRVNLEFTIAVGYIHSWGRNYNVPGEGGPLFREEGDVLFDYFGPTKAAVSLVIPFYGKEGRK